MTTQERMPPIYVSNDGDEVSGPFWVAYDPYPPGSKVTTVPGVAAAPTPEPVMRAVWDRYGGHTPILIFARGLPRR